VEGMLQRRYPQLTLKQFKEEEIEEEDESESDK
jgi:hypothetical protein